MYNGQKVFDVHGHVTTAPAVSAAVAGMLASNTAQGRSPLANGPQESGQFSKEAIRSAATDHKEYMDARNIDVQIIGPRPFRMLGWMAPHLLPGWTRLTNDSIHYQCQEYPDRFLGSAMLPQISTADDMSHCLPELERCQKDYGFQSIYLAPDPAGLGTTPGMHEAYWNPIYEKCQRDNLLIIIHGTNLQDPRIAPIPQNYQMGFVREQYLATMLLGHTDVFERYPELKVVVCHCGGGIHRFIPTDNHLAQKDRSKNLFYDTCGYDINYLTAAIKQRGVANMVFGTEAPGSGRAVRPETGKSGDDLVPIIDGFDWLTADDKMAIINKNPAHIFPAFEKVKVTA